MAKFSGISHALSYTILFNDLQNANKLLPTNCTEDGTFISIKLLQEVNAQSSKNSTPSKLNSLRLRHQENALYPIL